MKILLVGEYGRRGSGYTTIADGLMGEWDRRGHDVIMLALDYAGFEHPHKAAVVPTDPRLVERQAKTISAACEVLVVALDLSWHHALRALQHLGIPYVGIFPVESDPIYHPSDWTLTIDLMDIAFCESRFGTELLREKDIGASFLPIGIDPFFRPPTDQERAAAREQWRLEDRFVVYTVADNQERKNLAACVAAFALARGETVEWPPLRANHQSIPNPIENAFYVVNTKKRQTRLGYDIQELGDRFGVADEMLVLEHDEKGGLEREQLRELYWAADAFLLLSKAEGLGLPVLEAMACAVPVVATDCTGMAESLGEVRGYLVPAEYIHIDPFANQYRRWADPYLAALMLREIARSRPDAMIKRARRYAQDLTWERTGDVFDEEVLNVLKSRAAPPGEEGDRVSAGVGAAD